MDVVHVAVRRAAETRQVGAHAHFAVGHGGIAGQFHVDADVGVHVALVRFGHGQLRECLHVAAVGGHRGVRRDDEHADGRGGAGIDGERADHARRRGHVDLRQVAERGRVIRRHRAFVDFDHRVVAVGQRADAVQLAVHAHVAGDALPVADEDHRVVLVMAHFARGHVAGLAGLAHVADPGEAAVGIGRGFLEHGGDVLQAEVQADLAVLRGDGIRIGTQRAHRRGRRSRGERAGGARRFGLHLRGAEEQRLGGEGRAGYEEGAGGDRQPCAKRSVAVHGCVLLLGWDVLSRGASKASLECGRRRYADPHPNPSPGGRGVQANQQALRQRDRSRNSGSGCRTGIYRSIRTSPTSC
ncbi:hypothetical protein ABIE51_001118 [Lysobacter sp. OAE881]